MAISSSYYLNAPSLGSATAIFTDSGLTTCAPDGFYSDGTITREQVECILLPQQTCPTCDGVTYNCVEGTCTDPGDGSGTYSTLEACQAICGAGVSYNCIDGTCTDPGDGSGTYSTLEACETACSIPLVTGVGAGYHDELGEFYVDATVTTDLVVDADSIFEVLVSTSFMGSISVYVTIVLGGTFGSGSTYVGMSSPGSATSPCIASCDNPSINISSFSC